MADFDTFLAISDPNRRLLLEAMSARPMTVSALSLVLPHISRPAVSQHLKLLLECGWASVRRDGTRRFYSINTIGFRDLSVWIDQFSPKKSVKPRANHAAAQDLLLQDS